MRINVKYTVITERETCRLCVILVEYAMSLADKISFVGKKVIHDESIIAEALLKAN